MEEREITWEVEFSICVNGKEVRWSDLSEIEQETILQQIKEMDIPGNSGWGMF
jgi:hypothetical protein